VFHRYSDLKAACFSEIGECLRWDLKGPRHVSAASCYSSMSRLIPSRPKELLQL
jgi:hypothetical protein